MNKLTDEINNLLQTFKKLRDPSQGCPWDKEQDFKSIASCSIEEAYEVADAIEREDFNDLKEAIRYHFDPLKHLNINELSPIDRNEYYKKLAASGDMIDAIPYLDDEEVNNLEKFLKTLSFVE